ncbi:alpha-actinin, variant 2 [Entomophthora muscae]|uniref:Alpha-actinin, variant 2 n=1 Tax=Entomophthora muscae TaxID=34485 RepID=A0ACC2RPP0_9FUNG|nr:alpha-actinin, variant 2 [Entomophthora muscae]
MDKEWEAIQQKSKHIFLAASNPYFLAFTKWVNNQLATKSYPLIEDLYEGFSDGTALVHLLEALTDTALGKYNPNPKFRLQKIENLNRALKFIRERGISLTNIGAEDIVDGNHKLTLGMVWTIVLRFTIDEITEEGLGAKEGLLLWCQRKTADYQEVDVTDFSNSWKDGLAFCALIHHHYPELLDFYSLDMSDMRGNTALAFKVAEEALGIPQLLDVADLCDISKPDELSVMTYVAQYFHAFSELDRDRTAGRRVIKFVEVVQSAYDATNDYEQRVRKLLAEIGEIQESWKVATFDGSYKGAKNMALEFTQYKATTKRAWLKEKHELDTLLGNIQTKLNTYKLRPYVPPEGMTLMAVDAKWSTLIKAEAQRRAAINRALREIKQELRQRFASLANSFGKKLTEISSLLSKIDGDLAEQLEQVQMLIAELPRLEERLKAISSLDQECQEANIEENDDTIYSYEDLQYDLDLTRHALNKKQAFIENQIVSRNATNLTPRQLEEFESSFRHFDTDDTNALSLMEFQACLAALGFVFPDDEFEELFYHVSQGNDTISFEQYINFMVSSAEDKTTPDQLLEAFAVVADGKPYVTELDLKRQELPPTVIEYLIQTMPQASDLTEEEIAAAEQCEEGLVLDFNTYLSNVFYND